MNYDEQYEVFLKYNLVFCCFYRYKVIVIEEKSVLYIMVWEYIKYVYLKVINW